jgi:hypothetical protein
VTYDRRGCSAKVRRFVVLAAIALAAAATLGSCDSRPNPDAKACQLYNAWQNALDNSGNYGIQRPPPSIKQIDEAVAAAQQGSDTNLPGDLQNLQQTIRSLGSLYQFADSVGYPPGSKQEFAADQIEGATVGPGNDCIQDGYGDF